jgi:hypothetical protein
MIANRLSKMMNRTVYNNYNIIKINKKLLELNKNNIELKKELNNTKNKANYTQNRLYDLESYFMIITGTILIIPYILKK